MSNPVFAFDLPSGLQAELSEVLVDKVGDETWLRFRLIAPQIDRSSGKQFEFTQIEDDFPHLCQQLALPYMSKYTLSADRIVISMADRAVEFGTTAPDATQYFEQFSVKNGDCIWEAF